MVVQEVRTQEPTSRSTSVARSPSDSSLSRCWSSAESVPASTSHWPRRGLVSCRGSTRPATRGPGGSQAGCACGRPSIQRGAGCDSVDTGTHRGDRGRRARASGHTLGRTSRWRVDPRPRRRSSWHVYDFRCCASKPLTLNECASRPTPYVLGRGNQKPSRFDSPHLLCRTLIQRRRLPAEHYRPPDPKSPVNTAGCWSNQDCAT